MPTKTKAPNRLIDEKSPYLLQHAYNPVDWYPWGEEAFKKAKEEEKPVFLSIGYSTCHWCHVMERESFEDEEVAEILNDHFVAIKVDKEERPDIDSIYMKVCQALTGSGGWPLTIIMTPEKKPFFAGTYYPKEAKFGRPGLISILTEIKDAWEQDRERLLAAGAEIIEHVKQTEARKSINNMEPENLRELLEIGSTRLENQFEPEYGGFSSVPKFPMPHNLLFLLRYWKLTDGEEALRMVKETLNNLYRGGIYDQIGYGFSRYSTDRKWLVPHFEKMLYDNALLTITYLEAYQVTEDENYAEVAEEIIEYVTRDMKSEEGGFFSAEDADSEGVEGKFYLWEPEEIKEILGEERGAEFCNTFNITEEGNFEGKNIPNLIECNKSKVEVKKEFKKELNDLFAAREERVHPHKDDKILTSWNGLMIAALAKAGRILNNDKYLRQAEEAVEFIWDKLRVNGKLLARYREGEAAYLAYLEDYAFLIWGLIELYQNGLKPEFLKKAVDLNKELIENFWDQQEGGLYKSNPESEDLILQLKEVYDGAIPSGNSVATLNFLRLAKLTGDLDLIEKAEEQIKYFYSQIEYNPTAHCYFLQVFSYLEAEGKEIVVAGSKEETIVKEILQEFYRTYTPFSELILINNESRDILLDLNPLLEGKEKIDQLPAIYICKDFSCQAPITSLEEFANKMD